MNVFQRTLLLFGLVSTASMSAAVGSDLDLVPNIPGMNGILIMRSCGVSGGACGHLDSFETILHEAV